MPLYLVTFSICPIGKKRLGEQLFSGKINMNVAQRHNNTSSPKKLSHTKILLTGATGVLGGHLLKELLQNTKSKIYCLVRAENLKIGQERLLTFLRAYDPELSLQEEFDKRAVPVLGDISEENMGITPKVYKDLSE